MNILIIHEIDWINKVIFEPHHLAELFSKKGNNVFVIDCPNTKNKNFFSSLKTKTVLNYSRIYDDVSITLIHPPAIPIKGLNRISHFFSCKKIIKQTIVKNKIDIILLYGAITNGIQTIQIAKELKIPVIYRVLDISHALIGISQIRNLAKKYEKKVITNSNQVLATTPDLSRYAIEMGAKKDVVEYFPLGINMQQFRPLEKDLPLAQSLGISKYDNVIVFIGTLYPFVGLHQVVSNFKYIEEKNPNTKLIIIGGGPSYDKLHKLVILLKLESKIILTNFKPQSELPKYISLADICINPFEINYITNRILPTKILEYFACGKAVLSTPLNGTCELFPDETFGIIYSTYQDFPKTLSKILSEKNKLTELGKLALEYIQKNHDWDKLSDQIIEKFKSLTQKS